MVESRSLLNSKWALCPSLTYFVIVVLLPLLELVVCLDVEIFLDLVVQLAPPVRLHQHRLPSRLHRPVLRTYSRNKYSGLRLIGIRLKGFFFWLFGDLNWKTVY